MFREFAWNEKLGPGIPEATDSFAAKNLTGLTGVDGDMAHMGTELWIPGGGRQFKLQRGLGRGT